VAHEEMKEELRVPVGAEEPIKGPQGAHEVAISHRIQELIGLGLAEET
jgi:hypothetical protein